MLVIKQAFIHRSDLKENTNLLYIFGDNLQRQGRGGQAMEMRGEPNSFGFATKRRPDHGTKDCYFFDSDEDVFQIVEKEFENLKNVLQTGNYLGVVIPRDGIGTGLSNLPEYAPKLLIHINKRLDELKDL